MTATTFALVAHLLLAGQPPGTGDAYTMDSGLTAVECRFVAPRMGNRVEVARGVWITPKAGARTEWRCEPEYDEYQLREMDRRARELEKQRWQDWPSRADDDSED